MRNTMAKAGRIAWHRSVDPRRNLELQRLLAAYFERDTQLLSKMAAKVDVHRLFQMSWLIVGAKARVSITGC